MTGKEALEEIKEYKLVMYDEDGNEDDCCMFGEFEPNLIEAIEEDLDKLKQLEAIEEELGIDLITYFKLNSGVEVYTKLFGYGDINAVYGIGKYTAYSVRNAYKTFPIRGHTGSVDVWLEDYGKTWALTEEELEDE